MSVMQSVMHDILETIETKIVDQFSVISFQEKWIPTYVGMTIFLIKSMKSNNQLNPSYVFYEWCDMYSATWSTREIILEYCIRFGPINPIEPEAEPILYLETIRL